MESGMKFYDDDGTEINPNLIPKRPLCLTCAKVDDPSEEVLCTLTRMDQQGEAEFICHAFLSIETSW